MPNRKRGFTIIEIIMTVAVISILTAVFLIRYDDTPYRVESMAQKIASDLRYMRMQAIASGKIYGISAVPWGGVAWPNEMYQTGIWLSTYGAWFYDPDFEPPDSVNGRMRPFLLENNSCTRQSFEYRPEGNSLYVYSDNGTEGGYGGDYYFNFEGKPGKIIDRWTGGFLGHSYISKIYVECGNAKKVISIWPETGEIRIDNAP